MRILVALALLLLCAVPVSAQEAWCLANPSACVCSEPLTSATYTKSGNDFYKGDDPNSKPCAMDGVTGYGVRSNDIWRLQVYSDTTTLNKLPNRDVSKTPRFLGEPSGQTGDFMIGITQGSLASKARVAVRFYLWRDANFVMSGSQCGNTKEMGARPGWAISSYEGDRWAHLYNTTYFNWDGHPPNVFDGFEPSGGGAGPWGTGVYQNSSFRDSWTRLEMIVTNPSGPNHDLELYAKNITNGGAEQQTVRLSAGCTECGFENGTPYSDFVWDESFTPNSPITEYIAMLYKAIEEGTSCPGIQGALYFTVAAWDTNAGQRIGAASEVEGGSTPEGTTTLYIIHASVILLVIGSGVGMMFGMRFLARRRYARTPATGGLDGGGDCGQPAQPRPVVGPASELEGCRPNGQAGAQDREESRDEALVG